MSIFADVAKKQRAADDGSDDQNVLSPILEALSPREIDVWCKEVDISEALYREHGFLNVSEDMLERAFAEAGLEQEPCS